MAIGYVPMQEQTLIVQKQLVRSAQKGHRATQIENSIMRTGYTVVEDLGEQDDLNWDTKCDAKGARIAGQTPLAPVPHYTSYRLALT